MFLGSNIKFLRNRKRMTQMEAADAYGMKRTSLNNYENGFVLNPTIELLLIFSKYYAISIDTLLKVDLTKLSATQLSELENGYDVYATGGKLRVLASTVDANNEENIELVPVKAKAGYTTGYNDPEFISSLPTFQLPFLSKDRKYRAFQISGDSMLPIKDGSYVVGEFILDWTKIKDGGAYLILTADAEVVFKVAYNQLKTRKNLLLKSLNSAYEPYEVPLTEVKEVWKFVNYMSAELPEPTMAQDDLVATVLKLKSDVKKLMQ